MLMKNDIFKQTALLVAVVLLSTGFWSCSKDEKQDPEPSAVAVTGVTLKKTSISIQVDDKETLIATVLPEDATNKNISWKSDKPEIASVNANGKVTGVAEGEATITVTTEDGDGRRNGPHCGPISQRSFLCFCFHINRNPNKTTTV